MTVSIRLTFDVPGQALHCPMVAATIAGCTTKLIVDTGATSHLLTRELIQRAGLHAVASAPGRDVAGDSVPSWSVGDVLADIEGARFTLQDVTAIDGPEPFREWGVGGFLSPQHLAADATVVLDLAVNRLAIVVGGLERVSSDLRDRLGEFVVLEGVRHSADTLGLRVRISPAPPIVAILDTGAAETEVAAAALGRTADGPAVSSGRGVGGSSIEVRSLTDQILEVASARLPIARLGIRDTIPAPEDARESEIPLALIGMDLLRGTVIVIPPRPRTSLLWFVPKPTK